MTASATKAPRQGVAVTAIGRLGTAPQVKGRLTVASLAVNQRVKVEGVWTDGETLWFDLKATGDVLEGLEKGQLVTVTGSLAMRRVEGRTYLDIWASTAIPATMAKPASQNDIAFPE